MNAIALPDVGVPSTMDHLPDAAFDRVAEYFRSLAEPMRLQVLSTLRQGERSVGELADLLTTSVPNMSRHLNHLCKAGFIERESRGTSVYYRISDPTVFELCEVVCSGIADRIRREQQRWSGT